jgi:hypothetical protein
MGVVIVRNSLCGVRNFLRLWWADLAAGWVEHWQGESTEPYHLDGPAPKLEVVLTHFDNDTVDFQIRSLKRGWQYKHGDVAKVLMAVAFELAPPAPGMRVVPTEGAAQARSFHPSVERHALVG